jgi:UDP-N-acetylglucosamine--N-acetylmuramyl-(pentapeptide) pyrophosphoryl-undecaprenol N-acetylglucosamine transferase
VPNLAVIDEFVKNSRKHEILYVGARDGIEKEAVLKFVKGLEFQHLEFEEVTVGKLRRYFSFQNFVDFFKVPVGIFQAVRIVRRFRPEVVFSKGGFVAVPVVVGAGILNLFRSRARRIPIVIHESDVVPGLANRISARFADLIFVSSERTKKFFGGRDASRPSRGRAKVEVVGNPIRAEVLKGTAERGMKLCGFHRFKPVILVMGGSLGAKQVNDLVWNGLDDLLKKFQVVHIVGKGNLDMGLKKDGYKQFELLFEELKDVYAACDLVVSRGGANALAEIAALGKKAVIIPLGTESSRGDQIVNAKAASEEYGWQVLHGNVEVSQLLRAIDMASETSFGGEDVVHKKASKRVFQALFDLTLNA